MRLPGLHLSFILLGLGAGAVAAQDTTQAASPLAVLTLDSLLEMRVSTGAKYAQRLEEVASSVTIVTAEEIDRYGYRTLDQVLNSVPGFYLSRDRNYTYIGARGFGRPADYNNRLLVLIDGNAVNEGIFGSAPGGADLALPMGAIERIEIIRGPGSALYGTGAMFGVINIITRTPATLDGGRVAARAGSFGARGAEGMVSHRLNDGTEVTVAGLWDESDGQDLYYRAWDDPSTNNGWARGRDWERLAGVSAKARRSGFTLHGRYGVREKGIPTGAYETLFNSPDARTLDAFGFVELRHETGLSADKHLTSRAYYNHYKFDGDYPYEGDTPGVIEPGDEGSRYHAVGAEATLAWDLASSNRLTAGAEVRHDATAKYFYPRRPPHDLMLDVTSSSLSAYIQDEHHLGSAVSVLAGLRMDNYSRTEDALSPRAAVILRPWRDGTVKLLYGYAFRAPNVYEAGVETMSYLHNPNLRPERIQTMEAVWQQRLGARALWTASVFNYHIHDLIELTVDSTTAMYQYRNIGKARSTGFEAGIDARLGAGVQGFLNYTYQRTIDEESGERLTNSPAHLVKGGLSARPVAWLGAGIVARHESSRRTLYGTTTDPYFLADLHLELSPFRGGAERAPSLQVRVENLFDADYATPGGVEHRQPAIRQDGRTVMVELRVGF